MRSIPQLALTITLGSRHQFEAASSSAANRRIPPSGAPSRAVASMAITASGIISICVRTRSPFSAPKASEYVGLVYIIEVRPGEVATVPVTGLS